jgi:hypothetical protein
MDLDNTKNNQRQQATTNKSSVDDEVQKLFRRSNGRFSQSDFQNLRSKYGNEELVQKIEKAFVERHSEVTKKAKKFAQLIREKYSNSQYPFHILLEKAYKYKVKHGLKDDEFAEFQRIYENELVGLKSPEVYQPTTNVMKLLGSASVNLQGFNGKLNDNDYKILQEILRLHASSKALHAQVYLQSMIYEDCKIEAITGKYDRNSHNVTNHVHPVIAALFLPKIDKLEMHFLRSNIANIVKTRYNNEPFTSKDDLLLFHDLVRDPNDIVCDNRSTMADLYARAQLQNQLWNAVLNLRNGQYYNSSFREFMNAVDVCRLNKHDTPDLVYGRYDGTVIKRLLSAFSFRPTVVATMPVVNMMFSVNPYQQNIKPTVTFVPMINLKLPPSLNNSDPINLNDSLDQVQYFLENGAVTPKHTSLIYSQKVLLFYVDRRATVVETVNNLQPFSLSMPMAAASGFERMNDREVHFDKKFTIREDVYHLRSVVLSEVNNNNPQGNFVIGSSTVVMIHGSVETGNTEEFLYYDPVGVTEAVIVNGQPVRNDPITRIEEVPINANDNMAFMDMARKRGIIFMYQLVTDNTNGTIQM